MPEVVEETDEERLAREAGVTDPDETANGETGETGETDLGDAGKKAIDAMKAKWRAERDRAKQLEEQLAAANAPKDGTPDLDKIRADAHKEATSAANHRILRAEIRSLATGKMSNPALALKLLDLTDFEVDDDGNVDEKDISGAIAKLIDENPGLGVTQGESKRFQGSGDGGPRGSAGKPQLGVADLAKMTAEEIVAAQSAGQLKNIL